VLSERLELTSMSAALLTALLRGDEAATRDELGLEVPPALLEGRQRLLHLRLEQIEHDPAAQPWLLRLMVPRRGPRTAVGHIGFHGPPGSDRTVEVGYSVLPEHRGQGLATEACLALFGWASAEHGITRFRASVSPTNQPSLAVVRKLGFRRTGVQWDDVDGEELVFERDL
jgi:RimJ/RimL family protein N-acetyltransferase